MRRQRKPRAQAAAAIRQGIVDRLLDPVLTLAEVSVLLAVCKQSVRRYTDDGSLNCFRTPGNQRRFHLSDVLDFQAAFADDALVAEDDRELLELVRHILRRRKRPGMAT